MTVSEQPPRVFLVTIQVSNVTEEFLVQYIVWLVQVQSFSGHLHTYHMNPTLAHVLILFVCCECELSCKVGVTEITREERV